jgi:pyruvate kinase
MVARGDLGIETAVEKVPVMQKQIVAACLKAAKPVVVATQMLDSMIRNPRPTRAEVSDIANAVIDHADATMLSGETTTGKYPLEAVQAMAAAIRESEGSVYDERPSAVRSIQNTEEMMTNVASVLATASGAKAVLVASLSGQAARFVSRERPTMPIFVATPSERVACQLYLSWGVFPVIVPLCKTVPALIDAALAELLKQGEVVKDDQVVVVAGEPLGQSGMVNLVEIRRV